MKEQSNYLFIASNYPSPSFLNAVRVTRAAGKRPLLVYIRRNTVAVLPDWPDGVEVVEFRGEFSGVSGGRLIALTRFYFFLRKLVETSILPGSHCFVNSLDLALVASLAASGRMLRYHYSVSDLNEVQLSTGIVGKIVRAVERFVLLRVDTLVVSSPEYYNVYYKRLKPRRCVVLENVPSQQIWSGFKRALTPRPFTIGFVGIVRYEECLYALIDACKRLNLEGVRFRLRIAGGGDRLDEFRRYCSSDDFVEFTGPFAYGSSVKSVYSDIDLIYAVYDTRIANVRYAMPNKFYEALIAKIPIVVANGTYLERRVLDEGIGKSVQCLNMEAIIEVLRGAIRKDDWYRAAMYRLNENRASHYYAEHMAAVSESVFGVEPTPAEVPSKTFTQ